VRNFAYSSFRLAYASFEIRLVYTLFLIFIMAGLATTWALQSGRIGLSYERIVAYYLGGEIGGQIFFAKNLNALLEETHFHAFMISVDFLILCHLFIATTASARTKIFFIVTTFLSHAFDMGGVWLIRLVSPVFAYVLMAAWAGLWAGYGGMILIPLWEMWAPRDSDTE